MPPFVPRKRMRDISPDQRKQSSSKKASNIAPPRKATLFDDLDAAAPSKGKSVAIHDSDDDSSSLSSLSDGDFADVPIAKRRKVELEHSESDAGESEEAEDDDIEFEDVQTSNFDMPDVPDAPLPSGDLELTLNRDTRIALINPNDKKGPTKLERKTRIATHCIHVQLLLWHNAVRNAWLSDSVVQGILVSHIPARLWDEIDRWRRNSGLEVPDEEATPKKVSISRTKSKAKKMNGNSSPSVKASRDWGGAAERLERGVVDMSAGDPLHRLMKSLTAWWKQRFRVTAPGLRKLGYMSLERLDRWTKAYGEQQDDPTRFGERIESLDDFRARAQECTGSRDVGAQLFTSLLRGLGLEARMVANLQPIGFGWNKLEDADLEPEVDKITATPKKSVTTAKSGGKENRATPKNASARTNRKNNARVLKKDGSFDLVADDSDDESVVEITMVTPKKGATPSRKDVAFDKDLEFPHYWTEVLSPVTRKYLAVEPIVKFVVGTNREIVESFEPRGSKADKAKQVMAYVVGFSRDGTAKDVTVRYLKRQIYPGRTKGMRMPIEKVPVYGRNGKVKRYDPFDWFKVVMLGYGRGSKKCPITEVDEMENSTDLKPAKPEKKEVKEGEETLQYYKQSTEFVLERHLKREEALLPDTNPVKMFKQNKGKGKDAEEEPVYSRKDVVQVKSAETWHKQGRAPLPGEQPLKRVPYRAATTNRRREIAEAEAATGEKVMQGLYSFDQTDWIIPDPIENGIIPKNEYGNIDLFAEHMCPQGAVHVPYRGAVRVCKRLEIDFAEAVVGFEFGNRMAVPVIQGVVIAEEYHDQVMEELAKDEAERARKEDEKKRKAAYSMWRKFLMGMRIIDRLKRDYGDAKGGYQVFGRGRAPVDDVDSLADGAEDMAGGFLPPGCEVEEEDSHHASGFFPVGDQDDDQGGELVLQIEHDGLDGHHATQIPTASSSSQNEEIPKPSREKTRRPQSTRSRRARGKVPLESEDDNDDDEEEYGEPDDDYD